MGLGEQSGHGRDLPGETEEKSAAERQEMESVIVARKTKRRREKTVNAVGVEEDLGRPPDGGSGWFHVIMYKSPRFYYT